MNHRRNAAGTGITSSACCLAFWLLSSCAQASAQTVRDEEIAECRSGELIVWNDGTDRAIADSALVVSYRHDNAPLWFNRSEVEQSIANAARAWNACGIPISIVPAPPQQDGKTSPGTFRVQWSEAGSRGNFGLTNLSDRTLSLGPSAFTMLHARNPAHDARQTLQMVLSHEMGHFLGLMAHSRRCVDVLSYYQDTKGTKCQTRDGKGIDSVQEYRSILPTACDIQRCRIVNGRQHQTVRQGTAQ
ncbi:hypothetical protein [Propionivibrio dicarboxylicus]|uniref:Matrixin n=1 Tax=Propionivibrio dicarboxylicus TaxID=83767 RepID=A0A1G8MND9_9RHOO|nr:hypothetical protein [Propionivibrio dicarboxylicus]SDI69325.1 hypothetical protein SAMN05660652_03875 [Propionivibrio dicarboxylicus]